MGDIREAQRERIEQRLAAKRKRTKAHPGDDMTPGYYRVRDGNFAAGSQRWRVARWMPDAEHWLIGNSDKFAPDAWDEIGERVA